MTVLLQVQACQIELLVGFYLFGQQGGLCAVGDRKNLVGLGMPTKYGTPSVNIGLLNFEGQCRKGNFRTRHHLCEHRLRAQHVLLVVEHFAIIFAEHDTHILLISGKDLERDRLPSLAGTWRAFYIEKQVFRGFFHYTQLTIGHKVLREHLLLVWHQPTEVGLVFGIDTRHQFDVGTEGNFLLASPFGEGIVSDFTGPSPQWGIEGGFVRQVTVPGSSEVTITPCPLLLAGREVVGGNMQHTGTGIVLVAALKIEA